MDLLANYRPGLAGRTHNQNARSSLATAWPWEPRLCPEGNSSVVTLLREQLILASMSRLESNQSISKQWRALKSEQIHSSFTFLFLLAFSGWTLRLFAVSAIFLVSSVVQITSLELLGRLTTPECGMCEIKIHQLQLLNSNLCNNTDF